MIVPGSRTASMSRLRRLADARIGRGVHLSGKCAKLPPSRLLMNVGTPVPRPSRLHACPTSGQSSAHCADRAPYRPVLGLLRPVHAPLLRGGAAALARHASF